MSAIDDSDFPFINPSVRFVGVSKLRELKLERLRALDKTLVIQDEEEPLAVMLSYERFRKIQNEHEQLKKIQNENEQMLATLRLMRTRHREFVESIEHANSGKGKSFKEIEALLRIESESELDSISKSEVGNDLSGEINSTSRRTLQKTPGK